MEATDTSLNESRGVNMAIPAVGHSKWALWELKHTC